MTTIVTVLGLSIVKRTRARRRAWATVWLLGNATTGGVLRSVVKRAAYAQNGDAAKTAAAKAEVLRRVPGYTIATLKSRGFSLNPDYIRLAEEHWYSGLRKAGFPET